MSLNNTQYLSKNPMKFNLIGLNTPLNILMATVVSNKKILEDLLEDNHFIVKLKLEIVKENIPFVILDLSYENFDKNIEILKELSEYILEKKLYSQHTMFENDPDLWAELVLFH